LQWPGGAEQFKKTVLAVGTAGGGEDTSKGVPKICRMPRTKKFIGQLNIGGGKLPSKFWVRVEVRSDYLIITGKSKTPETRHQKAG